VKPKSTIDDCMSVTLPRIVDSRGNLTFIEGGKHLPFEIRRVFYLYDVPIEKHRGGHAHRELHQFLICLSGSFEVVIDDGGARATVEMTDPWKGLHIPPMIWAEELNFTLGTVCLVLASDLYKEGDYIRDYDAFLSSVRSIS